MIQLSTPTKLKIAKVLYHLTKVFVREDIQTINRNDINFEIYLKEGIDLHLFLFGSFQQHVFNSPHFALPKDGVVLDVGGNIGLMSLFFAKRVPNGQVHAFEPTHYALTKFKRNLSLNPDLQSIIKLNHCFISSKEVENADLTAYSSWQITKNKNGSGDIHDIHGGTAMDTKGVPAFTLDQYCEGNQLDKVNIIKIDTDGHELEILKGAERTIKKFKPAIVLELSTYVMKERGIQFAEFEAFFKDCGYKLYNETKSKEITQANYNSLIPKNGSIDAIALAI